MLALFSTPLRRWLLASLLLPVVATASAKVGRYLQRRNGGTPTLISRILLGLSSVAGRFSRKHQPDADQAAIEQSAKHAK